MHSIGKNTRGHGLNRISVLFHLLYQNEAPEGNSSKCYFSPVLPAIVKTWVLTLFARQYMVWRTLTLSVVRNYCMGDFNHVIGIILLYKNNKAGIEMCRWTLSILRSSIYFPLKNIIEFHYFIMPINNYKYFNTRIINGTIQVLFLRNIYGSIYQNL